jgi:hypothetical protein
MTQKQRAAKLEKQLQLPKGYLQTPFVSGADLKRMEDGLKAKATPKKKAKANPRRCKNSLNWGGATTNRPKKRRAPALTKRQKAIRRIQEADDYAIEKKAAARRTGRGKRNPDAETAAAQMSETFHGRPPKEILEIEQTELSRNVFSDLGRLIELTVYNDNDEEFTIGPFRGVRLVCTPAEKDPETGHPIARTIYFQAGDQALDLASLGIEGAAVKDTVRIGDAAQVVYHTSKDFHDFAPTDYSHDFGEETGVLPTLTYDTLNQRLALVGGEYLVKREGITN